MNDSSEREIEFDATDGGESRNQDERGPLWIMEFMLQDS
ncbi:hypothetical protein SBD_1405 [Streptomyces bottropensis ATCC 25435]|uniref:Uncharacterized protein n=1 Tax=Streptomyces bottropensis ATCC 25435 TaxID=1054862 RepID=M3F6L2_9ACTN|nr:hypothetical protein SBD_1405 [Streptomyces bottropensis ATCC 25435]